jgi:hypothetical protein
MSGFHIKSDIAPGSGTSEPWQQLQNTYIIPYGHR